MDIEVIRTQIPATSHGIYMNTGWSGPSPEPVLRRIHGVLRREAEGPAVPDIVGEQEGILLSTRCAVGRLINAAPEEVLVTQNTTEGLNMVINGMSWQESDEVVTCSLEHPSVLVPLFMLARRRGVRVRVVELEPWERPDRVLAIVEAALSKETRLVALSHIQYSCGLRLPIREIGDLARQWGARLLVDGAQAVGQVPVDVKELGCDFYSMPGQKWLLGPEGVGALYIRRSLIDELEPYAVSDRVVRRWDPWGSLEMEMEDITKFTVSTQSVALAAGLEAAIDFIQDIGVRAIEQRTLVLAGMLKNALTSIHGCRVISPLDEDVSSGLVSFSVDGLSPVHITRALWERSRVAGRHIPYPPSTRLCTAFFNKEEEVQRVAETIRGLVA